MATPNLCKTRTPISSAAKTGHYSINKIEARQYSAWQLSMSLAVPCRGAPAGIHVRAKTTLENPSANLASFLSPFVASISLGVSDTLHASSPS